MLFRSVGDYMQDFFRKPEAHIEAALAGQRGKGGGAKGGEGEKRRNELIKNEKLDDQFVQLMQRAVVRNPTVFGPLAQIARTDSFQLSDLDRMSQMAKRGGPRMGGKAGEKLGERGERMMEMAREEASHGPNKYVVAALTKNPPHNLAEAIKVYGDLFRSLEPQAKGFIAAMKNAQSASVPGYDDDLIDVLRGPFDIEPAPMLTKDLMETAQVT